MAGTPVARLPGGFALLDAEAVVLPYYESPRVTDLPAITGIRGLKSFSPRDSMKDNRLLVKALYFLQCHDEMGAGLGIEVDFIKLEPALSQLHVYVRENTRLKIRQHAVIRLPDRNIEEQYGKGAGDPAAALREGPSHPLISMRPIAVESPSARHARKSDTDAATNRRAI